MTFVYGLVDPRDSIVKYVGTSASPLKRLYQHISNSEGIKEEWLKELTAENLIPNLIIFSKTTDAQEALKIESQIIKSLASETVVNVKGNYLVDSPSIVGANSDLSRLRICQGFSLRDISKLSNGEISPSYLNNIERGYSKPSGISIKKAAILAKVYGISLDDFATNYLVDNGITAVERDASCAA